MFRIEIAGSLSLVVLLAAAPAMAGTGEVVGSNSDFPDANLVLPFDATSPRTAFFATSNIGSGQIDARWLFHDASGELITEVTRTIFGDGGTDIIDVTRVADRFVSGEDLMEGPSQSLAGRRGFAVVIGDGQPRLLGNFAIASTASNAAYGASAAGFGRVGGLAAGSSVSGTSFSPPSLQDNQLILIGLNPADSGAVTSLTDGEAPEAGAEIMRVTVELHGNSGDGLVASGTFPVSGSALFTSLEALFPGLPAGSVTIVAFAAEGSGYTGGETDPDDDSVVPVIGFYGQALGPFGTGQNLRTLDAN